MSKIKCIRAGKSKGLTDECIYDLIDIDYKNKSYIIINDLGIKTSYKFNRFIKTYDINR